MSKAVIDKTHLKASATSESGESFCGRAGVARALFRKPDVAFVSSLRSSKQVVLLQKIK